MKFKKGMSLMLSLAMCFSVAMSGTVAAVQKVAPIERVDLFAPEAMLDLGTQGAQQRHTHGPTVTELPDGDLFAVWFSSNPGGERDANECRIVGARSQDKGATWGTPFEVYNLDGVPSNNPVIYVDANNRLWLFYCTIINGQWVSAIPRYMYADLGNYEKANGFTENPNWHFPEPMYVNVGDAYGGEGRWDESTNSYTYRIKGDKIRHLSTQAAADKLDPSQYVEVTSRFNPNDTKYITDSFVVAIRNQVQEVVSYLETEKPYDDQTANRNDLVIQCINEGLFSDNPYKSEPSLKDGAIWRASGADNDEKTWNPAYRRIGWQTKNQPIEIKVPAGQKLSDGTTAAKATTRMLLPLYSDSLALSIVAYTDDSGATWGYSGPIAGLGNIQGTLIQKNDGTIYQYFRTGKLDGKNGRLDWKLVRAESKDYGVTWGNQVVEPYLRNDGGVGLVKAKDGTWVMVHNQEAKKDFRTGTRQSVTLSISKDEGQSWKSVMLDTARDETETGALTGMDYQYPGIIQRNDGSFVSIYTNGRPGAVSQVMRSAIVKDMNGLFATNIVLNQKAAVAAVGETSKLTAVVSQNGATITDNTVLFRTSDAEVATVDGAGNVKALKEGNAKIFASSTDFGTITQCVYTVVTAGQKAQTIAMMEELATKSVSNGTTIADLGLPTTIDAIMGDGGKKPMTITEWTAKPAYDGTKQGVYQFEGTLKETEEAQNEQYHRASVTVVVAPPQSSGGGSGGGGTSTTTPPTNITGNDTTAIVKAIEQGKTNVVVTLTGKTEIASEIFAALAGKDKTLTIKGSGYTWTINGKDITNTNIKVDFGVEVKKTVADGALPANVKAKEVVLGMDLKHSGAFPGSMTLAVSVGKENANKALNLYHLNSGAATFAGSYRADAQGNMLLKFQHASSYILTTQTVVDFKDIDNHWAKEHIQYLVEKGVVKGMDATTFAPQSNITRAQFVTILSSIAGADVGKNVTTAFEDVNKDAWFAGAVAWASEAGVTKGMDSTHFAPDSNITREQMAVMIEKFAAAMKCELKETAPAIIFSDAQTISNYAVASVSAVQKAGIINGKDNNLFAPKDNATRAEACKMLAILLKDMGK